MNEVERIDDAWSFYERSLGTLTSGVDEDAEMPRPSALHLPPVGVRPLRQGERQLRGSR
ncbi:MAG: hypothetical protein J0L92_35785 [Deltaproteobacteria bacterium]|nr:hypothetical protein [Deltaproteobacteria bacterium]